MIYIGFTTKPAAREHHWYYQAPGANFVILSEHKHRYAGFAEEERQIKLHQPQMNRLHTDKWLAEKRSKRASVTRQSIGQILAAK